jgi:hypothetical protein
VQLRLLEEKLQESEMRSRELEKQVASVGEGVSLESRHKLRYHIFFLWVVCIIMCYVDSIAHLLVASGNPWWRLEEGVVMVLRICVT